MNEFKKKYSKLIKDINDGQIERAVFEKYVDEHSKTNYFNQAINELMDSEDIWIKVYAVGTSIDYNVDMKKARIILKYILREVDFGLYTIEAENNLIKYRRKRFNIFSRIKKRK